jgi:hypothetical protein
VYGIAPFAPGELNECADVIAAPSSRSTVVRETPCRNAWSGSPGMVACPAVGVAACEVVPELLAVGTHFGKSVGLVTSTSVIAGEKSDELFGTSERGLGVTRSVCAEDSVSLSLRIGISR